MGKNLNKPSTGTVFCDIDGTLVKHNYSVETTPDQPIHATVNRLKRLQERNYKIVLTTARSADDCEAATRLLNELGIKTTYSLVNLGSGPRILINDQKNIFQKKAFSLSVWRNTSLLIPSTAQILLSISFMLNLFLVFFFSARS